MRDPDFIIGPKADPYLRRWWLIPRNRWFNIYLHEIRKSDDDRALHDHPYYNMSIVLRGGYTEMTPVGSRRRRAGSVVLRGARALHRLVIEGDPAWTIFVTGPRIRNWGFACPKGWVPWQEFVDERDSGAVGRGCGEV